MDSSTNAITLLIRSEVLQYYVASRVRVESSRRGDTVLVSESLVDIENQVGSEFSKLYAQQARNLEAEKRAAQIRIRAERKTGQFPKDTEKAAGNQHTKSARSPDTTKQTLSDIGISKDQSSK